MERKGKAVVLATFEGHALLMQLTDPRAMAPGWRLPRWQKHQKQGWTRTLQNSFRRYFALHIDRKRFALIKSAEVNGRMRHFFVLDLTATEADIVRDSVPNRFARVMLVRIDDLESMDTFGEKERALIEALKN